MVKYAKKKPNKHNQVVLWDTDSFCLPTLQQLFRAGTQLLNGPQCASFPLQACSVQKRKALRCQLWTKTETLRKKVTSLRLWITLQLFWDQNLGLLIPNSCSLLCIRLMMTCIYHHTLFIPTAKGDSKQFYSDSVREIKPYSLRHLFYYMFLVG